MSPHRKTMRVRTDTPFDAVVTYPSSHILPENRQIGGNTREQLLANARSVVYDNQTLAKIVHGASRTILWTAENGWTEAGKRRLPE